MRSCFLTATASHLTLLSGDRLLCTEPQLAVIGSDIQEVVGSGVAFNLLSAGAIPVWIGCLITALDTVTFLGVGYFGVRYLEGLVCLFIGVMLFCFFQNWVLTGFEPKEMLTGWAVPYLPSYGFTQAVGTLGAVIMPHNLYLHSGLVLSRKVTRSSPHRVYEAVQYARIEMAVALLVAFAINLSVVATNSSSFFSRECAEADEGPYACLTHAAYELINGEHPKPRPKEGLGAACTVTSRVGGERGLVGHCGEIGLENAGLALADTLGGNALTVWALGMLAAGQASTMVCTYAGQIIMGGLLAIELPPWKRVALTRVIAIGPSLAVALYATSDPGALNFGARPRRNNASIPPRVLACLPAPPRCSHPRTFSSFSAATCSERVPQHHAVVAAPVRDAARAPLCGRATHPRGLPLAAVSHGPHHMPCARCPLHQLHCHRWSHRRAWLHTSLGRWRRHHLRTLRWRVPPDGMERPQGLRVAHRTPPRQLLHLHTLQVRRLLLAPLRRSVRPPRRRLGWAVRRAAAAYH